MLNQPDLTEYGCHRIHIIHMIRYSTTMYMSANTLSMCMYLFMVCVWKFWYPTCDCYISSKQRPSDRGQPGTLTWGPWMSTEHWIEKWPSVISDLDYYALRARMWGSREWRSLEIVTPDPHEGNSKKISRGSWKYPANKKSINQMIGLCYSCRQMCDVKLPL